MTDGGQRYLEREETREYEAQFNHLLGLYSAEMLENALRGVLWGISTKPEEFPRLTWNIFRALSESYSSEVPDFTIFFSIKDANTVLMLWIEEVRDEVMQKLT